MRTYQWADRAPTRRPAATSEPNRPDLAGPAARRSAMAAVGTVAVVLLAGACSARTPLPSGPDPTTVPTGEVASRSSSDSEPGAECIGDTIEAPVAVSDAGDAAELRADLDAMLAGIDDALGEFETALDQDEGDVEQ